MNDYELGEPIPFELQGRTTKCFSLYSENVLAGRLSSGTDNRLRADLWFKLFDRLTCIRRALDEL